jgi:hypothetical protein
MFGVFPFGAPVFADARPRGPAGDGLDVTKALAPVLISALDNVEVTKAVAAALLSHADRIEVTKAIGPALISALDNLEITKALGAALLGFIPPPPPFAYRAVVPGGVDIPDILCAPDSPVVDDVLVHITENAAFTVVRLERIYMGFYKHGDTVGAPVSPADGYAYAREECQFEAEFYSTRAPGTNFQSGQALAPMFSLSQPANLYWTICDINDQTGQVALTVSYYRQGGAETISTDGMVRVYALCQRMSVSAFN